MLRLIQDTIEASRIEMTDEEAMLLWPKINAFVREHDGRRPERNSPNPLEKRLAEALLYLQKQKREHNL